MHFFANKFIKPFIRQRAYSRVCEIGASTGENTAKLLELKNVSLSIIDPGLDADLAAKHEHDRRVKIHQGISLDVLPTLTDPFDCILIDGDHNWYTVYHELKIIEERGLLKAGGAIFFHDVCWPYARRDMYYQPELIPQQFRHPHEQKGIAPGRAELSAEAEFNSTHHNAVREGGARNGVLTAVEDFLKEQPGQFRFVRIEAEFGLGALFKKKDFRANLAFTGFLLKAKTFEHQLKLKEAFRRKLPFLFSSLARLRQRSRRREQAL